MIAPPNQAVARGQFQQPEHAAPQAPSRAWQSSCQWYGVCCCRWRRLAALHRYKYTGSLRVVRPHSYARVGCTPAAESADHCQRWHGPDSHPLADPPAAVIMILSVLHLKRHSASFGLLAHIAHLCASECTAPRCRSAPPPTVPPSRNPTAHEASGCHRVPTPSRVASVVW